MSRARRTFLISFLGLPPLWVLSGSLLFQEQAWAGAQAEEPLADSVRSALSSSIANAAPPVPEFSDTEARLKYLRWLGAMSERLKKKKADWVTRKEFLQTVWYESKRAGLDVSLVLGLVQVESNFRKFAVSSVGARGYMQVMPFWSRLIGDGDALRDQFGKMPGQGKGSRAPFRGQESIRRQHANPTGFPAGKIARVEIQAARGDIARNHPPTAPRTRRPPWTR